MLDIRVSELPEPALVTLAANAFERAQVAVADAKRFLDRRIRELGIESAPTIEVQLCLRSEMSAHQQAGVGSPESRQARVFFDPESSAIDIGAMATHEMFHAIGARTRNAQFGAKLLGRSGGGTSLLFESIEECAAYGNELLFRREHNSRLLNGSINVLWQIAANPHPIDVAIARAYMAIHEPQNAARWAGRWDEFERWICNKDIIVPLVGLISHHGAFVNRSAYSFALHAFLRLADEIYPDDRNARQALLDQASIAVLTGNLRSIVSTVRDRLGMDAVRFLSELRVGANTDPSGLGSGPILLSLFAEAKTLAPQECMEIRRFISRALNVARYQFIPRD